MQPEPAAPPTAGAPGPGGQVNELKTLVIGYAKQETVEPLKVISKRIGWGLAGGVLVSLGLFFCVLATLRGLQTIFVLNRDDGDSLGGWFSWVPYLGASLVAIVFIALLAQAISRSTNRLP